MNTAALYGRYQQQEDAVTKQQNATNAWRDEIGRRSTLKALNLADLGPFDPMKIQANQTHVHTGVNPIVFAAALLAASLGSALGLYFLTPKQATPAVASAPAATPATPASTPSVPAVTPAPPAPVPPPPSGIAGQMIQREVQQDGTLKEIWRSTATLNPDGTAVTPDGRHWQKAPDGTWTQIQ